MKTNSQYIKFNRGMLWIVGILFLLFFAYLGGQVRHFVENVDYYTTKGEGSPANL